MSHRIRSHRQAGGVGRQLNSKGRDRGSCRCASDSVLRFASLSRQPTSGRTIGSQSASTSSFAADVMKQLKNAK